MHKLINKRLAGGNLSSLPAPPNLQTLFPGLDVSTLKLNIPSLDDLLKVGRKNSYFSGISSSNTIGNTVGTIAGSLGSLIPQTPLSGLTTGLNLGYDAIANTAMAIPGVGSIIGGAMKVGGMLSDGLTALGVGTDLMTTADKILDSKFLKWNVGLVNAIGAKKANTITKDNEAFEQVGSSYGGVSNTVDDALTKSGKKYGLFSNKLRNNANRDIALANNQLKQMSKIADASKFAFTRLSSMSDINNRKYINSLQGGYIPTYVGQKGLKFPSKESIEKARQLVRQTTPRSIDLLIAYAKNENPRFIQRLSETPRGIDFIDDEGNPVKGSHYLESAGEYVIPRILELKDGSLKFFNHLDAVNRALETGNYLKMSPQEAELFAREYKKGWPQFFNSFKLGGKMNVIPEGALHARLHHMDINGITKKGIPVITKEEGGEIVLHAEIERDEIIFTKEVTEKLEELYKKGTDEAAIEAGKILTKEIMENTLDNTGLMQTIL